MKPKERKVTITCSEKQLQMLSYVCDRYARLIQGFEVYYVGDDIEREVSVYSFQPSRLNPDTFTDKPQDGGDHCMDAINYGSTHLRLQYITSE